MCSVDVFCIFLGCGARVKALGVCLSYLIVKKKIPADGTPGRHLFLVVTSDYPSGSLLTRIGQGFS